MLKIDTHGIEIEITDAIAAAIQTKLGALGKYLASAGTPQELSVRVGMETDHHNKGKIYKAEADLSMPGHKIHAETVGDELYAAIDELKDELKHRLLKTVKTTIDQHRDGARLAKEQGTETELV